MYKKAVSIVPDIEARTFLYTQSKSSENQPAVPQVKGSSLFLEKILKFSDENKGFVSKDFAHKTQ